MSTPFKTGGYVPAHPPELDDYFQWRTTDPVTVTRDPACTHPSKTWLDVQDKRSDSLQNYGGWVCEACGKILEFGKIDPGTGEPRSVG